MEKIDKYIKLLDVINVLVLIGFLFLAFIHKDLNTVGLDSLNYVNGHFLNFYDFNNEDSKNYLPSTYVIFAIWNALDIKLLNFGFTNLPKVFWYKLEMLLFGLASAAVIYKIIRVLNNDKKTSLTGVLYWLSSPLIIFCLIVFTQSDILTCFFMLLGIYFYLKDKTYQFCFYFGIATTFKYFPFLIFLPLLVLREKNLLKILKYLLFFSILFAIEVYIYIDSVVFQKNVLGWGVANDKLFGPLLIKSTPYVHTYLIVFSFICAMAYSLKSNSSNNIINKLVFYIPLFILSFIFVFVDWYPQWFLLITPFMALTTLQAPSKKTYFYVTLEIVMYYFYIAYIVHFFYNYLDQNLLKLGVFGIYDLLEFNKMEMRNLFYPEAYSWSYTVISASLLIQLIFKFPIDIFIVDLKKDNCIQKIDSNIIRKRFYLGVFIWLIPALLCISKPNPIKTILLLLCLPMIQFILISYRKKLKKKLKVNSDRGI